jgi:hypothetical protein
MPYWVPLTGAAIDLGDATPTKATSHGGFHHENWWISGELTIIYHQT